jgi:hypothetical protein
MSGPLSIDRIVELKRERDEAHADREILVAEIESQRATAERFADRYQEECDKVDEARAIARRAVLALHMFKRSVGEHREDFEECDLGMCGELQALSWAKE